MNWEDDRITNNIVFCMSMTAYMQAAARVIHQFEGIAGLRVNLTKYKRCVTNINYNEVTVCMSVDFCCDCGKLSRHSVPISTKFPIKLFGNRLDC